MQTDDIKRVSGRIIGAAMRVHSRVGPGLLEHVYEACLAHELGKLGMKVATQSPIRVRYDDVPMGIGFHADLIVDDAVIVELKAVTTLLPVHRAQLLSYLRLTGIRAGLLINFHEVHLRDGIRRIANDL